MHKILSANTGQYYVYKKNPNATFLENPKTFFKSFTWIKLFNKFLNFCKGKVGGKALFIKVSEIFLRTELWQDLSFGIFQIFLNRQVHLKTVTKQWKHQHTFMMRHNQIAFLINDSSELMSNCNFPKFLYWYVSNDKWIYNLNFWRIYKFLKFKMDKTLYTRIKIKSFSYSLFWGQTLGVVCLIYCKLWNKILLPTHKCLFNVWNKILN